MTADPWLLSRRGGGGRKLKGESWASLVFVLHGLCVCTTERNVSFWLQMLENSLQVIAESYVGSTHLLRTLRTHKVTS